MLQLSDQEFAAFQRFIFEAAGISLSDGKKALVAGRLAKRVEQRQLSSYGKYLQYLQSGESPQELQEAVDLLTTNETYFFREPKHFELLGRALVERRSTQPFRVWSAASSSGEEAYSIAMVLADRLPGGSWEVLGSDISVRVLQRAARGHYPMARAANIPQDYLRRFCLRGMGEEEGTLLVSRELRQRVRFLQINLNAPLPALGRFSVIFLRNVLIYFNMQTKQEVVSRVAELLEPGGYFLVSHSETLNGLTVALKPLAPAVYRKE